MANNNNPSSKKAFTSNQICMHLIADCKPNYRPKVVNNNVNRDFDYKDSVRKEPECNSSLSHEEELNAQYLIEQEEQERNEREQRIDALERRYGYTGPISDQDDLDLVEYRAETTERLLFY